MNKTKVAGYALIVTPIVAGMAILAILYGTDVLKAVGCVVVFVSPIALGCHLLAKS